MGGTHPLLKSASDCRCGDLGVCNDPLPFSAAGVHRISGGYFRGQYAIDRGVNGLLLALSNSFMGHHNSQT